MCAAVCGIRLLIVFTTWRFSITDVCLVSLGLARVVAWAMWSLGIQYWIPVQMTLFQSGSGLINFVGWVNYFVCWTVSYFPCRVIEATWRSREDVTAWNEKTYGEPSKSKCPTSSWIGSKRSINLLPRDTVKCGSEPWIMTIVLSLSVEYERLKNLPMYSQITFRVLATTTLFFYRPYRSTPCPSCIFIFSIATCKWWRSKLTVLLTLFFNAE